MFVLHLHGWVHRDISANNVYWYQDSKNPASHRGLLGDLEYCRKKVVPTDNAQAVHEVRTVRIALPNLCVARS